MKLELLFLSIASLALSCHGESQASRRRLNRNPTTKLFAQNIGHLVDTRLDPLVNPEDCSSHVHSVLGNARFGSTLRAKWFRDSEWQDTTDKVNQTTSELIPNLSSYWVPSLYVWHSETQTYYLVPSFGRTYYRIEHLNDDASRLTVNPYPEYLRLIVGDASRKDYWQDDEVDRDNIRWTLTTQNRKTTDYLNHGDWSYLDFDTFHNYKRGQLEMLVKFPNCLAVTKRRGKPIIRSDNFRDHASYSTSETWDPIRGWCPESHPYPIPRLDLEMRYDLSALRDTLGADVVDDPANWVLSTGDASGAGGHADFVAGWPTELMANVIANCTDGGHADEDKDCWLDGMDLDGRDGRGKSIPYDEPIPNEPVHAVSSLPGSNGASCPEMVPATEVQ